MNPAKPLTCIIAFCLVLTSAIAWTQDTQFGRLEDHVRDLISSMPGGSGNHFTNPDADDIIFLEAALETMLSGDLASADSIAALFDYVIIRFIDNTLENNQEFIILEIAPGSDNYWGTIIYNPNACSDVVLQCPHPRFDSNTGIEGAYIFTRLHATAMMLSGTHRCNSSTASNCSGSTSVCGTTADYRISDVAHNDKSAFHWITRILDNVLEDQLFIQLHGFAKQEGDPNLIVSNGTRDTPDPDPITRLTASFNEIDPYISFRIAHIDTDWTRLTAFTNTQGRYLNLSPDACSANASTASGKFIHIEQEFDLFRNDETGWDLMLRGIDNAFGCTGTATYNIDPLRYFIIDNKIEFDGVNEESLLLEVYSFDGIYTMRSLIGEGKRYDLPVNTHIVIVVRDLGRGDILLSKKLCILN